MSGGHQEGAEDEPLLSNEEGLLQSPAPDGQSVSSDSANDEHIDYKRTLAGFLSYSAAAEAFSIVSVALFLPLCLEAFARENGRLAPLHRLRCPSESPVPQQSDSSATCEVRLLGLWVGYPFPILACFKAVLIGMHSHCRSTRRPFPSLHTRCPSLVRRWCLSL